MVKIMNRAKLIMVQLKIHPVPIYMKPGLNDFPDDVWEEIKKTAQGRFRLEREDWEQR